MKLSKKPIPRLIQNRLWKRNKNYLGIITGQTGSGKSWSALSIANTVDHTFNVEKCVMNPLEFMNGLVHKDWGQGDMIVFDEAGVGLSSKEYMTIVNRAINDILQTFRRQNIGVLFTVPSKTNVDKDTRRLLHGYFETLDYIENSYALVKYHELQYNARQDKIYHRSLRDDKGEKLNPIAVKKPPNDLIRDYENKRSKYQNEVNEQRLERIVEKMEKKRGKNKSKKEDKKGVQCNQCDYEWTPRNGTPPQCPKCGSRKWDE